MRVWRLLFIDYVICALLASLAGFVLVGHTNSAALSLGSTYLLPSIAAVIIGGTSFCAVVKT
jgi:ribose transport system permease protein